MATTNSTDADVITDIVIVGGGPVGLAAGCCLAESGLGITLVDAGQEVLTIDALQASAGIPEFDARVSALTVASEKLLKQLGAWEQMATVRLSPYQHMQVWDGEGTGAIEFSAAEIHVASLGHIVENRVITAALTELAQSRPGLSILHNKQVEQIDLVQDKDQPVRIQLNDKTMIAAKLLVGADGANSFVREQAQFKVRQWDYGHEAIVTTVKTEQPHASTAWQRFIRTGPLAFLPMHLPDTDESAQCYSSIVWSCVTERAEGIKGLGDDEFNATLGEAFEFRLGEILEADTRISFPLWQRHATDYVQDNLVLIGDAAHTIHPLAGQGVNLGLGDVQVLYEVISSALGKGEDFATHQVLSRFQRRRKGQNMGMMAAMEGFKRIFASDDLAIRLLRNTGLDLTDKTPMLKHRLMRQAMGL